MILLANAYICEVGYGDTGVVGAPVGPVICANCPNRCPVTSIDQNVVNSAPIKQAMIPNWAIKPATRDRTRAIKYALGFD